MALDPSEFDIPGEPFPPVARAGAINPIEKTMDTIAKKPSERQLAELLKTLNTFVPPRVDRVMGITGRILQGDKATTQRLHGMAPKDLEAVQQTLKAFKTWERAPGAALAGTPSPDGPLAKFKAFASMLIGLRTPQMDPRNNQQAAPQKPVDTLSRGAQIAQAAAKQRAESAALKAVAAAPKPAIVQPPAPAAPAKSEPNLPNPGLFSSRNKDNAPPPKKAPTAAPAKQTREVNAAFKVLEKAGVCSDKPTAFRTPFDDTARPGGRPTPFGG